ncbi:carbon-nitrogen hydrolase family protein [Chloroflexota bacterium]
MKKSVRVGLVLPETYFGEEEWKNAEPALAYVDEAAREGVQMVVFPEGYPGPMTGNLHSNKFPFKPISALQEKARQHGVYIAAGDIEENPEIPETYFLTLKLISPEGEILARYVRMQPDTPPLNAYLYNGKAHLLPGKEFKVVDTDLGNIGLLICSEISVPELCRIVMLRGADILIAPRHGGHSKTRGNSLQKADTTRCIARARAAENLYYVLVTVNFYRQDRKGAAHSSTGAFIAGPEKMIASRETPGLLVADLDLARLDYLRSRNQDEEGLSIPEEGGPEPIGCRAGQTWERRPEIYTELTRPHKYAFNYDYFEESLDKWIEEYEKIYGGKYAEIQKKYGKLQFK